MSISIYYGRAGSGKTQAVYARIAQVMKECPGDPIILLVPEPATYRVERELAEFMPQKGFTTVRVVGFGRLGYQVYQSIGSKGDHQSGLTAFGRAMLLRLVMKRKQQELGLLEQATKRPEFSSVLQQLFSEFRAFRIGPDDLERGAESVKNGVLQKKLRELALCMAAYEEEISRHGERDIDPIMEIVEALPHSPLMENCHVFIDGFHWFTPTHYELIYTLFDLAKEAVITVDLPMDPEALNVARRGEHLFSRPLEIYDTLVARYGSRIEWVGFDGKRGPRVVQALESDFFTSPARANSTDEQIPLIRGHNREREGDAVARRILDYVESSEGARYRDVCVMLRESETYGDTLEKVFTRYGIPHFIDRQRPMKNHPLGELLTDLFGVVRHSYSRDSMFRLLKTDLMPLTREAVDELENYVLEFGIDHYKWESESWSYLQGFQRGRDDEETHFDAPRRARVNVSRQIIMDILSPWFDFASNAEGHTGGEWGAELYRILEVLQVPHRLYEWTQDAEASGDQESKASHEQMYNAVISFIDEVSSVMKDEILTLDEMMLLLEEGLRDINYSMIPPSLDHVVITTIERGYSQWWPKVFVMGLNQGVFPQSMGDEGLIKDRERQELAEAGITLAEGALPKAFNENFLLYLAMTRGGDSLTLSYAGSGEDGTGLEPALVIKRLESLGYVDEAVDVPLIIMPDTEERYLWRPNQSLSLLSERWGALLSGEPVSPVWWGLYNWARESAEYRPRLAEVSRGIRDNNDVPVITQDLVNGLFLSKGYMSGSVTRLEKYQQCPFRFYAQYGLRLEPRKVRSFGAPEIGTFLHANLERLGNYLLEHNQQWRDLDERTQREMCSAVADEIVKDNQFSEDESSAYQEAIEHRVQRTLESTVGRLVEWSKRSDFNTKYLEQNFGLGGGWDSINVPLGADRYLRLVGQIDRIDEYTADGQTYGMVIDYKSGGAKVSAQDVYYGLKLQLMTYLLALESAYGRMHGDSMSPAAVVYTYVKNPQTSSDAPISYDDASELAKKNSTLQNSGYFADDVELLTHIDNQVLNYGSGKGPYVPLRIGKNQQIYKGDKPKVKSSGDFDVMCRYTRRVMARAGQQIGDGLFPIKPYQLNGVRPCTYCEYQNVCRFDSSRNQYNYLSRLAEEDALNSMKEALNEGDEDYGC
ncbi:ATP-dependent nuclease subunit B [Veillonella denticariosi JCM 15641]|uniref:ATP-dependent nuclease subunit B n=1 Tax=Veillonella denticariosi JCM 15641 TaxID=1298594 RepID=A0A2S7ZAE6_9FIRM|nr:PD-(D/E)XK nuclease family protein [Veillonella denticariosi]PQL20242.1 ATP-dependent nuclease subunit B [Veillonella denticariosi JCM 15641]